MQETKKPKQKCGICCIPVTSRGVLDCCSDIFCFSCIDTWSAFTNLCPLCKLQFKFITCAPVAEEKEESLVTPSVGEKSTVESEKSELCNVETEGAFVDFLGQESKEESWHGGTSEDVDSSFPSFFIEEDAVVCLDGDGCKVRTRSQLESGFDGTSVACDSCDCWYHAVCVGYKPDPGNEQTWICPRCTGTGVLDLFRFQPLTTKNYTPKPLSNRLSLDNNEPTTFADKGEAAALVSIDLTTENNTPKPLINTLSLDNNGPNVFVDEGKIAVALSTDSLMPESQAKQPETAEAMVSNALLHESNPKTGEKMDSIGTEADIIDKTSPFEKERSEGKFGTDVPSSFVSIEKELNEADSIGDEGNQCIKQESEQEVKGGDATSSHLNEGSEFSQSIVDKNDSSNIAETNDSSSDIVEINDPSSDIVEINDPSSDIVEINDPSSDILETNEPSKNVVETSEPFKNIIETNKPSKNIIEGSDVLVEKNIVDIRPPGRKRKASENVSKEYHGEKKKLKAEDRSGEGIIQEQQSSRMKKDISHCVDDKHQNERKKPKLDDRQFPLGQRTLNKDTQKKVLKSKSTKEVVSNVKIEETCSPPTSFQEDLNPKMDAADELKELVQGMNPCNRRLILHNGEGNDIMKKIVYRGNDLDESVCKIIDEMRNHLMKTANEDSDSRKVDVTDDKFFAAFKAAVMSQSSLEVPSKKTVLGPCPTRDASRQNLMKKLCGGSTKYDRDWDISFWKGRVDNQRQTRETSKDFLQKEIAQIEESKSDPNNGDNAELQSLRNRVFLADTSLLPRQTDIKPLSKLSEQKSPARAQQGKGAGPKRAVNIAQKNTEVAPLETKTEPITDKRQWALNILARKKKTEEKPQGKKGSLLEGLPQHLRPVLEYERRSKVPTASRQLQIDRFIEFYLRRAQLDSLDDSPQLRAAIQEAVDKEKEIYDRSNSKGVYNNLCVQALSTSSKVVSKPSEASPSKVDVSYEDPVVLAALKAAGLVSDSPPESPCRGQEGSLSRPSEITNQEFKSNSSIGKIEDIPAITAMKPSEAGSGRIKEDSISTPHVTEPQSNNDTDVNLSDVNTIADGNEEMLPSSHDMEKFNECGQYQLSSETLAQVEMDNQLEENVREDLALTSDNCSHNDKEDIKVDTESMQDKTSKDEDLHTTDKISKQVERFVKEHIRPLHKSHVISTEQYNWAVSKTTKKVMQHHKHSKNAHFLISEGEKVKRLAEQYLQLYDGRKP